MNSYKRIAILLLIITFSLLILGSFTKGKHVEAITYSPAFELKMDDGVVNYDSVSQTNIGTLLGNPTIENNTLKLNGSSGIVLDNIDTSQGFTVEFDFMRPSTSKPSAIAYEVIMAKSSYANPQNDNREWGIFVTRTTNGTMAIKLNLHSDSTTNNWDGVGTGTVGLTYDEYHHVKVQATDKEAWLFVDDTCYGTYSFVRDNTKQPITIGHTRDASNKNTQFFTGNLDNLKLSLGVEDSMNNNSQDLKLRYNFEKPDLTTIHDVNNEQNNATLSPSVTAPSATTTRYATGIEGNGIYLDGKNLINTPYILDTRNDFTVSIYFKVDALTKKDQVIIGQANYANNIRDFTVYISSANILTVNIKNLSQNNTDGWIVTQVGDIKADTWYNFTMTVQNKQLTTYLNGYKAAEKNIETLSFAGTNITIGGVITGTNPTQLTAGHFDEVNIYSRALEEKEIFDILSTNLILTGQKNNITIATEDIYASFEKLENVEFSCVSKSILDGYKWQHGGAIAYHNNLYYASWGRNTGSENTAGEEMVCYTSVDGKNWVYNQNFVAEEGYAYSHGNIFEANGKLYMMSPYYAGSSHGTVSSGCIFNNLKMHGFILNEQGTWDKLDFALPDFWPLQQAYKLNNGNYIMAGIDTEWRASVAISNGDDMTDWKVVKIPFLSTNFTESNLIVEEDKITIFLRNEKAFNTNAITTGIAYSYDNGETWTLAQESNLSANTSKPCAGILGTGHKYLITNSVYGANTSRNQLTISIANPGSDKFSKMFLIRDMAIPNALKETYSEIDINPSLSYPYATEYNGKLYVIYSSWMHNGANLNNIELAVIDINELVADQEAKDFAKENKQTLLNNNQNEIKNLYTMYLSLDKYVQNELIEDGFYGLLMDKYQQVLLSENQEIAQNVLEEITNIINATNPQNIKTNVAEVMNLYNSLTNVQKATLNYEDIVKIEAFIKLS